MGSLERRIESLEAALGGGECPVCGYHPEKPIADYAVIWDGLDDPDDEWPEEPRFCEGCGRQLDFFIVWHDLPPTTPEREEYELDE